jgi:hypothetical protein
LQNAKQLQHASLSWRIRCPNVVVSGLKIIGHRNPNSNLESHCVSAFVLCR